MMKKILLYTALTATLLGSLSSCNEKWEVPNEEVNETGFGTLSTADLIIEATDAGKVVESRADIDFSNYIITVYKGDTEQPVEKWNYADMPGLPKFHAGEYTLTVESCKLEPAAFDAPYYLGSKKFTIEVDKVTSIGTVKCPLSNLQVSVVFDQQLVDASAGDLQCKVQTLSDGSVDASLIFTPETTVSGYFKLDPDNTTLVAEFTGTVNGYSELIHRPLGDIKVGEHHIITFTLKESDWNLGDPEGGLNFGSLQVDMTVSEENKKVNINPGGEDNIKGDNPGKEDWGEEPGPDDPTPTEPAATFSSATLNLDDFNTTDVNPAALTITCPKGIAKLIVAIDSPSLYDALVDMGLADPFDLVNPATPELAETIDSGLGLPYGKDVEGKTEFEFDITKFMKMLAAFAGDHIFTLTVTDSEGETASQELKFRVEE